MVARIPTTVHSGTTVLNNTHYELMPTQPTVDDITSNVIGFGAYVVNEGIVLDFLHGVSASQTIRLNAGWHTPTGLILNDPADFHGHIEMNYNQPSGYFLGTPPGTEQLSVSMQMVGRAVDSYSFKNDMLSLWSHNHVVQQLSLTVHDPYGITVQAAKGGWIFVSANDRSGHGIPLNYPSVQIAGIMPVHV